MESVRQMNKEAAVSVRQKAISKNDEWAARTGSARTDRREPPAYTGGSFVSAAESLPCASRHRVTRGPVKVWHTTIPQMWGFARQEATMHR